ncbi:MAG: hypothetical protein ACFB4J_06585 [Elainellaceae cyanobacterium]
MTNQEINEIALLVTASVLSICTVVVSFTSDPSHAAAHRAAPVTAEAPLFE